MPDSPREAHYANLIFRKGVPCRENQPEDSPLTLSELGVLNVVAHAGTRYQRRVDEDGKYVGPDFDSTVRRSNANAIA